jgi:hypothetical protein
MLEYWIHLKRACNPSYPRPAEKRALDGRNAALSVWRLQNNGEAKSQRNRPANRRSGANAATDARYVATTARRGIRRFVSTGPEIRERVQPDRSKPITAARRNIGGARRLFFRGYSDGWKNTDDAASAHIGFPDDRRRTGVDQGVHEHPRCSAAPLPCHSGRGNGALNGRAGKSHTIDQSIHRHRHCAEPTGPAATSIVMKQS